MRAIDEKALEAATRAICKRRFCDYSRMRDIYERDARVAIEAYLSATKDAQAERVRVLEEALADALGVASHERMAALDAKYSGAFPEMKPTSDADWHAFQDRIRAALNATGDK